MVDMKVTELEKTIYNRYASQINNLQAPGMPMNRIAIFVDNDLYTESGIYYGKDVEYYINEKVIPWAFMNGIYLNGMTHGNFAVNRNYKTADEVVDSKEEDYSLNVDVLNYVFGCMAAATEHSKEIVVVIYIGEEDMCRVWKFNNEEEFTNFIKEDLEYLEEE